MKDWERKKDRGWSPSVDTEIKFLTMPWEKLHLWSLPCSWAPPYSVPKREPVTPSSQKGNQCTCVSARKLHCGISEVIIYPAREAWNWTMFLQKISMWIQKGVFSYKRSWVIILRNRKVTSEKMTGRAVGCCVRSMWQEGRMCRHMILKVVLCLCVWRCLGLHRMTCSLLGEYKAELFAGFANHVTSCQQTNRQEEVSWLISHLRASYITVSEPRGKLLILILKMGCFGGSCFSFVKKSNYYYNIYYLNERFFSYN